MFIRYQAQRRFDRSFLVDDPSKPVFDRDSVCPQPVSLKSDRGDCRLCASPAVTFFHSSRKRLWVSCCPFRKGFRPSGQKSELGKSCQDAVTGMNDQPDEQPSVRSAVQMAGRRIPQGCKSPKRPQGCFTFYRRVSVLVADQFDNPWPTATRYSYVVMAGNGKDQIKALMERPERQGLCRTGKERTSRQRRDAFLPRSTSAILLRPKLPSHRDGRFPVSLFHTGSSSGNKLKRYRHGKPVLAKPHTM